MDGTRATTQSDAVRRRLGDLPAIEKAKGVSVYLNMPRYELITYPSIIDMLFEGKKDVYVPKVTGSRSEDMKMVRVRSVSDVDDFETNAWGIKEPTDAQMSASVDAVENGAVDVVLVPGVAFDARCRRLGHGKGYYDSFIARLRRKRAELHLPMPITIGVAFNEQIVDNVPVNENDETLDVVLTPKSTFTSAK